MVNQLTTPIPSHTSNSVTTTVTTSTVDGSQLVVGSTSSTQQVGNFVTDVTLQPYIAPRIISFFAYNMRPSHIMHIFFDGENVDEYCAPGVRTATNTYSVSSITNTSDPNSIPKNGNWGTEIYSDANGIVAGQFQIPAGKFKTGERIMQISDVESLALGSDAYTSISSAKFVASNISVTKQAITLTTVDPVLSYVPLSNTVVTTNTSIVINKVKDVLNVTAWYEPIAQALTINTPDGQPGIYATSIDIYFKQRSQAKENGVTLYLCETKNGYPDGSSILPFSTTHLEYSQINVSSDGTVPTTFTFESPVFLNNGVTYAFIIKPDANDPDYYVYSALLGDVDLSTGQQVFSQPAVGTAFYGATMTQWTALQKEYFKFNLKRASFTSSNSSAYFENSNTDYLSVSNFTYVNNSVGIGPGDYAFQASNSSSSTANVFTKGVLNYYDNVKGIVYVDEGSNNFTSPSVLQVHRFANSALLSSPGPNTTTLIAYANLVSISDVRTNAFVPQFSTLIPAGTGINFKYLGTSNSYSKDTVEQNVTVGYETEFYDYERTIASKTNERLNMSSQKSLTLKAEMYTDSEYVSPLIDTVRHQQLSISNEIDPVDFNYNEFFNNGQSQTKYISQVITLAPGQEAQDLQISLTAYKPVGSDIQVWAKFKNSNDGESFNNKTWVPLINKSMDAYSDPSDPSDYRELNYSVAEGYPLLYTNGTISTTNTSTTVTGTSTLFSTELEPGWFITMRSGTQQLITNSFSVYANSTGFSNTTDTIKISNANTYINVGDRMKYVVPTNNTAISTLANNTYYYVVFTNSSSVALSATLGGANIDITDTRTTNPGETHTFYHETTVYNFNEKTRKIMSIASDTSLVIDSPFIGNYTSNSYYICFPPTTAWASTNYSTNLSGTVSVSTSTNIITGTGTSFTTELSNRSIIKINGDQQQVVSVTNSTSLAVGTVWSSTISGINAYSVGTSGLTYYNNDNSVYNTFKQFQIKIILQSDDTARVPLVDDLRALALQL
jgi:hypothetical protein